MDSNKQKEEFARRLAEAKPEEEEEKQQGSGNVIRARAYNFNFNAPQAGYHYQRTRIASS